MSRIRSVDTKAEVRLRKALFARGLRYRKNVRALPGKPDIVFTKRRYIVQVRGCFWHAHDCRRAHSPDSNTDYWGPKLRGNVDRDERNDAALVQAGWKVRVVWECEISSAEKLAHVADAISRGLLETSTDPSPRHRQ